MAVTITSNKKNTSATIHVSAANTTIQVSGNSTTTNVDSTSTCLALDDEVLSGVYITQIFYGIEPSGTPGYAVLKRGSTVVGVYDSTGYKDYAGNGMALTVGQSANLSIEFVGTANGYVLLEVQKVGTFISAYNNP
jgi:hypothetical protein